VAAAKRRRFDALLVWKLDRLARSVRHLTTLAGELEALGVDLIVPGQAIDTSTPTGRLLFNMLGAIAEFERDLIRERVVAGMKAAQRRGKAIGRPQRIQGDQRDRVVRLRGRRAVSARDRDLARCVQEHGPASRGTAERIACDRSPELRTRRTTFKRRATGRQPPYKRRALERDPVPIQGPTRVRRDTGVGECPAVCNDDTDRAEVRRLRGEQDAPEADATCLVEREAKQFTTDAPPSLGRANFVPDVAAVEKEHGDQLVTYATAGDDSIAFEKPEPANPNPIRGQIFPCFEHFNPREEGFRVVSG